MRVSSYFITFFTKLPTVRPSNGNVNPNTELEAFCNSAGTGSPTAPAPTPAPQTVASCSWCPRGKRRRSGCDQTKGVEKCRLGVREVQLKSRPRRGSGRCSLPQCGPRGPAAPDLVAVAQSWSTTPRTDRTAGVPGWGRGTGRSCFTGPECPCGKASVLETEGVAAA